MNEAKIKAQYKSIIEKEMHANQKFWRLESRDADIMYNAAAQLLEIAKQSMIPRSYIQNYHLSNTTVSYESIGAHANLMTAIVDRAVNYECEDLVTPQSIYKFSYREIIEAARRHDLPENVIGDIPDDGTRDDVAKAKEESKYWREYSTLSPGREVVFEMHVNSILNMMNRHEGMVGRLLHVSDKASAILMVLCYDQAKMPPVMLIDQKNISDSDIMAMSLCDYCEHGVCKASEMWSIVYFKIRQTAKLDDTGFITGILIMATLIVNGKWYSWREEDYT